MPKKPDAVMEAPLMMLPLAPVAVNAWLVMPDAPTNVAPARGAYTPEMELVEGIPVKFAPLPKKPEAVTDAPPIMLPLGKDTVMAVFLAMVSAPVVEKVETVPLSPN